MKLRSVAVNQFRKFTAPTRLDGIGDGLNILIGPNEMGKSTLLDAIGAVFFERYSSAAKPIRALQNDRNRAAPVVHVDFELEDGGYRIEKRFLKKPYARLHCPDGRRFEGGEAERALRERLSFEQPGTHGANPETRGIWSVLWVRQGDSLGSLAITARARASLYLRKPPKVNLPARNARPMLWKPTSRRCGVRQLVLGPRRTKRHLRSPTPVASSTL